ncbi:hypothetical protein [Pseudomonas rhizoryzae]|uniref:hypothetical protein n=1 Tax=Pseudomonas rhizoryzae TaxID=2571129 RepID=UPI0007367ACE|nr:hypothetical protein [Pseudomonas rhizoryzae]KTT29335.1 hypothetical protein NS201_17525 [Pseudomonas psychrotolerans]KTT37649.1 hypothetical protein SB9_01745 [Pseudomonas psychrotolerans]KTT72570.1 hypothetical protein SB18R_19610 [Pseudomonas psychrotolerans]
MKRIAAGFLLSVFASVSYAEDLSTSGSVTLFLVELDQGFDASAKPERLSQTLMMVEQAMSQCRNDRGAGEEAENIAKLVESYQKSLAKSQVNVSAYDLLDVLHGTLLTDKERTGWDCSGILSYYKKAREGLVLTHIGGYNVVQEYREQGVFFE